MHLWVCEKPTWSWSIRRESKEENQIIKCRRTEKKRLRFQLVCPRNILFFFFFTYFTLNLCTTRLYLYQITSRNFSFSERTKKGSEKAKKQQKIYCGRTCVCVFVCLCGVSWVCVALFHSQLPRFASMCVNMPNANVNPNVVVFLEWMLVRLIFVFVLILFFAFNVLISFLIMIHD